MKPGDLVKYEDEDGAYFGIVLNLDTDPDNRIIYHIRWNDGTYSHELESTYHEGVIKVIQ